MKSVKDEIRLGIETREVYIQSEKLGERLILKAHKNYNKLMMFMGLQCQSIIHIIHHHIPVSIPL